MTADGATADTDWPKTCAKDNCPRRRPETGELLLIGRTSPSSRVDRHLDVNFADRQMRITITPEPQTA